MISNYPIDEVIAYLMWHWYKVMKKWMKEWSLRHARETYEWPKRNTFESRWKRNRWPSCRTLKERERIIDLCLKQPNSRNRGGDDRKEDIRENIKNL